MHIFLRHCYYSNASAGKNRPEGFSRQDLLARLVETIRSYHEEQELCDGGAEEIKVVVFLDTAEQKRFCSCSEKKRLKEESSEETSCSCAPHFAETVAREQNCSSVAKENNWTVVKQVCGSEAKAFQNLIQYILTLQLQEQETICILEDDYKLKNGWIQAAKLAFQTGAHYITLYDHPDKYGEMYQNLTSKLYFTNYSNSKSKEKSKWKGHWRTTPSTTNSFITTMKTLREDADLHAAFSQHQVTQDHQKFLALWAKGRTLISSIPAFWSHEEVGMQCDLD